MFLQTCPSLSWVKLFAPCLVVVFFCVWFSCGFLADSSEVSFFLKFSVSFGSCFSGLCFLVVAVMFPWLQCRRLSCISTFHSYFHICLFGVFGSKTSCAFQVLDCLILFFPCLYSVRKSLRGRCGYSVSVSHLCVGCVPLRFWCSCFVTQVCH